MNGHVRTAGVLCLGVFALVANYVSEIETQVGDKIVVLELTRPAVANQAISDDMVVAKRVPRRWAPRAALSDRTQLVGVVAAANLQPRSILQEGMLVTPPEINKAFLRVWDEFAAAATMPADLRPPVPVPTLGRPALKELQALLIDALGELEAQLEQQHGGAP